MSVEFYVAGKWQNGEGEMELRKGKDRRRGERRQGDRRLGDRRCKGRRAADGDKDE